MLISSFSFSQDFPIRGEIYDYEVGDVFHYKTEHTQGTPDSYGTETTLNNIIVIDKYFSIDNDTVFYQLFVEKLVFNDWNDEEEFFEFDNTIFETNLNDYFTGDTAYENQNIYNGRLTVYYTDYWTNGNASSLDQCIHTIGIGESNSIYNNCDGAPTYYCDNIEKNIVYYKKGDEEWGVPQIIVGMDELSDKNKFSIFPNPASDFININTKEKSEIQIFNSTGQLILSQNANSINTRLDISDFSTGVYFLNIMDEDGLIIGKSKFLKH